MSPESALVRPTARVIIVSPQARVLLFTTTWPDQTTGRRFWFPPGGGVEADESHEKTAVREVREETGLLVTISRELWHREHTWQAPSTNRWTRSVERYFVAYSPTERLAPTDEADPEMRDIQEKRWWSIDEMRVSDDLFVPRELAALLADVSPEKRRRCQSWLTDTEVPRRVAIPGLIRAGLKSCSRLANLA